MKTLYIWDHDSIPSKIDGDLLIWGEARGLDTYSSRFKIFSMHDEVDADSDNLKRDYLRLVKNFGMALIKGKTLVNYMEIEDGSSFWWKTLIAEKCNFGKSPNINTIIKLLKFEDICIKNNYAALNLNSDNKLLIDGMNGLANKLGINVNIKRNTLFNKFENLLFPQILMGMIWLIIYFIKRYKLKDLGLKKMSNLNPDTTFVNYLFGQSDSKNSYFESRYWGDLPKMLTRNSVKSTWLHIYVEDHILPNAKKAKDFIQNLNKSNPLEAHVTLDAFLSVGLFFKSIGIWCQLMTKFWNIKNIPFGNDDHNYLVPLFHEDWSRSIFGRSAISNVVFNELFAKYFSNIRKQRKCFYLLENQGWEFSCVYNFKKNNHKYIYGVQHSTIRYWDLRYYNDSSLYLCTQDTIPLPDYMIVNSEHSYIETFKWGYPKDKLLKLEALRYSYLGKKSNINKLNSASMVLILGDFDENKTYKILELMKNYFEKFKCSIDILFRPHPNFIIKNTNYKKLKLEISKDRIESDFSRANFVIASDSTSAALDAYCYGLKLVVVKDAKGLCQSPLYKLNDVQFISTIDELHEALLSASSQNSDIQSKQHFYYEENLKNWNELIMGDQQ